MYQGENVKFEIELKDHAGNVLDVDSTNVELFIYRESDNCVYLTYSTSVNPGYTLITRDSLNNKFSFIVTGAQSAILPLGVYYIQIKSVTTNAGFGSEGEINMEAAPLFTIQKTMKDY